MLAPITPPRMLRNEFDALAEIILSDITLGKDVDTRARQISEDDWGKGLDVKQGTALPMSFSTQTVRFGWWNSRSEL